MKENAKRGLGILEEAGGIIGPPKGSSVQQTKPKCGEKMQAVPENVARTGMNHWGRATGRRDRYTLYPAGREKHRAKDDLASEKELQLQCGV